MTKDEEPQPITCICGHVMGRHGPDPEGGASIVCHACDCDNFFEEDTEAMF